MGKDIKILKTGRITKLDNVEYVLRDKDGNIKPIFQTNRLFSWAIKKGWISPKINQHKNFNKFSFLVGKWSNKLVISNLITSAGKAGSASRLMGAGGEAAFTYMAIGTGTTAANIADTTLQTEITTNGGQRAAGTASRVTTTVTNDTAQLVLTYTFTGSFAVTESGILNAASVGTLLCRQVFSAINVASGDTLQITWKIQES